MPGKEPKIATCDQGFQKFICEGEERTRVIDEGGTGSGDVSLLVLK